MREGSDVFNKKSLRGAALVLMVLILIASISGCVQPTETPKPAEKPTKDKIVIGFTVALSGPGAATGTEQLRAYLTWKEWVNSKGGIYVAEYGKKLPVEFIYYDDGSEPARAKSLYEKLIVEDKVDLLLAPWGTYIHLAIVPVIEKYGIPVVGNTAGVESEKIEELKTQNMFFTWPSPETSAMATVLFLEKVGVKNIALLYAQTDFTVANAKWVKKIAEDRKSLEIVLYEGYPYGATDLKGVLLKIKDKNVDAVVIQSYPPDAILTTTQMKELKINPKLFMLGVGGQILAFYEKFDNATKEGIVAVNNWHPVFYPESSELYSLYIKNYGFNPPSHTLGLGWLSCIVLGKAIEKAGSLNTTKIRNALATEAFETAFGDVKFEKQVNVKSLIVFDQWQNGELKPIAAYAGAYPNVREFTELKMEKIVYPKPEW
ncbi:MAG: amino acid ABC transporter substrate-binding protein [Candidatus Aenigmatarchaeota archaeon]